MNNWKEVVIEQLMVAHIYRHEHEGQPRLALHDLIDYHMSIALDPAVSQPARDLINRELDACIRECNEVDLIGADECIELLKLRRER